jgi:hypothetical protein
MQRSDKEMIMSDVAKCKKDCAVRGKDWKPGAKVDR